MCLTFATSERSSLSFYCGQEFPIHVIRSTACGKAVKQAKSLPWEESRLRAGLGGINLEMQPHEEAPGPWLHINAMLGLTILLSSSISPVTWTLGSILNSWLLDLAPVLTCLGEHTRHNSLTTFHARIQI